MQIGKNRQRLFRWGSLAIVVVMALSMTYCSLPSDPGVPRWNIPLAIPFASTTFGLDSLVAKPAELDSNNSGVVLNDDGSLGFFFADSIPQFTIAEEHLSYDMDGTELAAYDVETDTLVIPMDDTRDEVLLIDDILDDNGVDTNYEDGDPTFIPNFTIPTSEEEIVFDDLDSIRSAHVMRNGGTIDLTVNNNTELYWDYLQIEVQRDDLQGGWTTIGTLLYEEMDPRTNQTHILDLGAGNGTTLTPTVRLIIDGGGEGGPNIPLYHADNMTFEMYIETLKCDSAYAIIPAQEPEIDSTEISLGGTDDWITEAVISEGTIFATIVNETDVSSEITLSFPDVYDTEGNVWEEVFELDRARTGEDANRIDKEIDLAGYVLRLEIPEEGMSQVLRSMTKVEILGSGELPGGEPEYSRIALGDRVYSDFQATALTFQSVKLIPKSLEMEVDRQTQEIDVFEGEEDLQSSLANNLVLADVHIEAGFSNSFDIPVNLILNFTAENTTTGHIRDKQIELFIDASQDTIDPIYGLEDILNIYPNKITFDATVQAGRDFIEYDFSSDNEWGVALGDSILGQFYLKAPLALKISEETALRPAPQSMSDKFEAPLQQARLFTSIRNTVPFGGRIYVIAGIFDTEEDAIAELVIDNPNVIHLVNPPLSLRMPNVVNVGDIAGDAIYRAESAVLDTVITVIDKEALNIFEEENVYVREILVLEPTTNNSGEAVYVGAYAEDNVEVTIVAEVEYRVNEEDDEEGGEE